MSCTEQVDLCIVRGDDWSLDVGLPPAWQEVEDNPADYLGHLVFRAEQSDGSTVLLTLTSTVEVIDDALVGEYSVHFNFDATSAQTSTLPYYDIVAYCELVNISGASNVVTRLFNASVAIED